MNPLLRSLTVSTIALLLTIPAIATSDDPKETRNENASQVAKAWFVSLMRGYTAVTTSLSEVPFSFDRKQEVENLPELKEIYDGIVSEKGKRDLMPTSVEVKASSPDKVEVVLMIGDEGVLVLVKPGDAYRVIGFSD